ncbi:uncharacterized protein BCR38DRAFT_297037, partial [Pseudomassariella vexata]
ANASVWVAGLPYDVTYHELLASIRGCGKVKWTNIDFPRDATGTATAQVIFFRHIAAKRFIAQGQIGQVVVNGARVEVSWNRVKTVEEDDTDKSRVLRISGPQNMISERQLMAFLMANFQFDIDDVIEVWSSEESACLEVRFASWRSQAHTAKIALCQEY